MSQNRHKIRLGIFQGGGGGVWVGWGLLYKTYYRIYPKYCDTLTPYGTCYKI